MVTRALKMKLHRRWDLDDFRFYIFSKRFMKTYYFPDQIDILQINKGQKNFFNEQQYSTFPFPKTCFR